MTKNKHKNKPWILQEFGISLSTEPTLQQLKKAVFLLNSSKQRFLFENLFIPLSSLPTHPKKHPNFKSDFAPPLTKSTSCATGTCEWDITLNRGSLEITLTAPLNYRFYFEKNTLQYTV